MFWNNLNISKFHSVRKKDQIQDRGACYLSLGAELFVLQVAY